MSFSKEWLSAKGQIDASFRHSITEEKKKEMLKIELKDGQTRLFCFGCGNVHIIDLTTAINLLLVVDDENFLDRDIEWQKEYIETSFCKKCNSAIHEVQIKYLV